MHGTHEGMKLINKCLRNATNLVSLSPRFVPFNQRWGRYFPYALSYIVKRVNNIILTSLSKSLPFKSFFLATMH